LLNDDLQEKSFIACLDKEVLTVVIFLLPSRCLLDPRMDIMS
jgi:hypothetical protein